MKLFRILSLGLLICVSLAGCGETQETVRTLYEAKVSPEITAPPENSFSKNVAVGPENNTVPLKVSWTSNLGKDGCLNIRDVKVERTGGSPNMVIDGIRHDIVPCGEDFNPTDGKRFQTVLIFVNYKSRTAKGNSPPIGLRGDGKPMVDKL